MTADSAGVQIDQQGPVATLTLDRPAVLNAWNAAMRQAFVEAITRLNRTEEVRALVVTGAGERAFSVGEDFNEARCLDPGQTAALIDELKRLYTSIVELDKPVVAALNGAAMGLGLQVALLCDLRVAHPEVLVGQPEITVGIPSVIGPSIIEMLTGRAKAIEFALTGRSLTGSEAHDQGLVNELSDREAVRGTAWSRARALADAPPVAMRLTKRRFAELALPVLDEAFAAAARAQREAFESGEPQQAMNAFLERRGRRKGSNAS